MPPIHPWKARLGVGVIMIVLAFLGMVVTDVRSEGGWDYWKWMVPVYAILALWLSWYVKRKQQTISPITIWHEILHWAGLIAAIFLVSYLVHLGTISRFIAGIFHLILLSLGVFLAGIYIESIFLLIGIILGIFALVTAFLVQYMFSIVVPLVIGGVLITGISIWISHKKFQSS
ncbi:MAG: hypothetical protein FJZ64_02570 [Chlamydiae bacterium]|nr:hypothetical protein [Chlamydiota bacterium]